MAREVSQVHLNGMAADIDRVREASSEAGVTNNTVTYLYEQRDQRVTNTGVENHNTHAMMMNFMAHHQGKLAAFAVQRGISNERAMALLAEHLKRQHAQPYQVVQIRQQTLVNPNFEPRNPKPHQDMAPLGQLRSSERRPFPFHSQPP